MFVVPRFIFSLYQKTTFVKATSGFGFTFKFSPEKEI